MTVNYYFDISDNISSILSIYNSLDLFQIYAVALKNNSNILDNINIDLNNTTVIETSLTANALTIELVTHIQLSKYYMSIYQWKH
jgi:hypothetical protein